MFCIKLDKTHKKCIKSDVWPVNCLAGTEDGKMSKERRDVRKSKDAIKDAFIQLIITQDIRKVTVNQILELADVSRGTFYAHFQDIYDVQEQVENDLLAQCLQTIGENDIYKIIEDPYPQVLKCIRFLIEHAETIRSLSNTSQNGGFITKYKKILKEGLLKSDHSIKNTAVLEIVDACIIGAVIEGCVEKIVMEVPMNTEETARVISRFISRGIKGMAD